MKRSGTAENPPLPIGQTSSRLVSPDTAFRSVHNLYPTEEGGYLSIRGPLPVIPDAVGGPPPSGAEDIDPLEYGNTNGIFHARLMSGARDVMLIHSGAQIWEFRGWDRGWGVVIGPESTAPLFADELIEPTVTDYRTQWVATPTGVVIIPQQGRSYFYDGIVALPLGYDRSPGPPTGLGPESSLDNWNPNTVTGAIGVNDQGYALDGLLVGGNPRYFKYGRVGTVTTPGNVPTTDVEDESQVMGYLEPGRWRCRTQWIDRWGNLSPMSPPSNDVRCSRQPSIKMVDVLGTYVPTWVQTELVRKQIAWDGVRPGPTGTIARNLIRTKDLMNSGDARWYELPRDASVNTQAIATMPDNISRFYPDNIPDAWLVNEAVEVLPVPQFRLAEMAFGRLFMADDKGAVYWSMTGRWGTIERGSLMYPDPAGAAVTGMKRVAGGLLVFTETGTYLITPNDQGTGFRSATLAATIGCCAPQSIVTMRNGVTVWLGRDGFYAYANGETSYIFSDHRYHARRFNRAVMHRAVACFDGRSGQYRCWVGYESGASSDLCFCYDGTGWHTRDDIAATGVCVTDDHRKLCIASGVVDGVDGAWVLDHGGEVRTAEITTGWLRAFRSKDRASVRWVWLWLRETGDYATPITVSVSRDYRSEVVSTSTVDLTPAEADADVRQIPANAGVYDTAVFGTSTTWRVRRPYWVRVDIDVPTCEVFRLSITSSSEFEILGISFDEQPRDSGGATAYGV